MRRIHVTRARLAAQGALLAALWPAVAAADPQCKTPFESPGCFFITTFFLSIFALPLSAVTGVIIMALGLKRAPGRGALIALTSIGALPVTYVAMLIGATLSPEGLAFVGITLVSLAAYVYIAARFIFKRPAAASR
jgi:hypothetical protein